MGPKTSQGYRGTDPKCHNDGKVLLNKLLMNIFYQTDIFLGDTEKNPKISIKNQDK